MNLSLVVTKDYENIANWTLGENKPNSKPIKPNLSRRPVRRSFSEDGSLGEGGFKLGELFLTRIAKWEPRLISGQKRAKTRKMNWLE